MIPTTTATLTHSNNVGSEFEHDLGPTLTGTAVVSGATSLSPHDVTRIEITSNDSTDLFLAALN